MSVLTKAGVPILNTISITAQIAGNVLYKKMWLNVYEEVRQGNKIATSMAQYSLMPTNVVQMIKSGENPDCEITNNSCARRFSIY